MCPNVTLALIRVIPCCAPMAHWIGMASSPVPASPTRLKNLRRAYALPTEAIQTILPEAVDIRVTSDMPPLSAAP